MISLGQVNGKVAIVTGAAKGMGEAHAKLLAEEGAKVVVADLDVEAGKQVAEAIGKQAIFVELDVTDKQSWSDAVDKTIENFGSVDVLVNNAGYAGRPANIMELEEEEYYKVVAIDQHGTFLGMKAVIPQMTEQGGGSIVNISSLSGIRHNYGVQNIAYTAAKFAVRGLTKAAAVELGDKNIRVNAVLPGGVLTPMAKAALSEDEINVMASHSPLNRMAEPEEISEAVLFLASDRSSYANGADFLMDGGWATR